MTKYKIGDKIRILEDRTWHDDPNSIYKAGEIHTVAGVDGDGDPWFSGGRSGIGWGNSGNWFEKVEEEKMTKYKVGDKVRIVHDTEWDHPTDKTTFRAGEVYEIATIDTNGWPHFSGVASLRGWSNMTGWFEKITDDPASKTLMLTPYIKPKTVTIDGVEYVIVENN